MLKKFVCQIYVIDRFLLSGFLIAQLIMSSIFDHQRNSFNYMHDTVVLEPTITTIQHVLYFSNFIDVS